MYIEEMYVTRIKLIALSQAKQLLQAVKAAPAAYRKDTAEYVEAIYYIINHMSEEGLNEIKKNLIMTNAFFVHDTSQDKKICLI